MKILRKIVIGAIIAFIGGVSVWLLKDYIDNKIAVECYEITEAYKDTLSSLRDSIQADTFEMEIGKCRKVFDNEFILCLNTDYKDENDINASFFYTGIYSDKIDGDDRDFEFSLVPMDFLGINYRNKWHIVRALQTNWKDQKVEFSMEVLDSLPKH